MSLFVYLAAVNEAALAWEDASETVRGSYKSLADVNPRLLGPRVAPAAEDFFDTWVSEMQALKTTTADHGDALREAALLVHQADADALERSQQLLPWDDRDISPNTSP